MLPSTVYDTARCDARCSSVRLSVRPSLCLSVCQSRIASKRPKCRRSYFIDWLPQYFLFFSELNHSPKFRRHLPKRVVKYRWRIQIWRFTACRWAPGQAWRMCANSIIGRHLLIDTTSEQRPASIWKRKDIYRGGTCCVTTQDIANWSQYVFVTE